mmetsp:Transcript_14710/g.51160  ORF Transcript_14710/g.51160 Transcript_14710/m.51160 type:complete len:199 (+) Transcript_14710:143-739(+)
MAALDDGLQAKVALAQERLRHHAAKRSTIESALEKLQIEAKRHAGDARTIIRELTRAADANETRATATFGSADTVDDAYALAVSDLAELQAERAELMRRRAKADAALRRGTDADVEEDGAEDDEESRVTHALSLFANITRINWDHDLPEHVLGGAIAYDEAQTARRFSIQTEALDSYEIADRLWDLLEGEGERPDADA